LNGTRSRARVGLVFKKNAGPGPAFVFGKEVEP